MGEKVYRILFNYRTLIVGPKRYISTSSHVLQLGVFALKDILCEDNPILWISTFYLCVFIR